MKIYVIGNEIRSLNLFISNINRYRKRNGDNPVRYHSHSYKYLTTLRITK